MELKITHGPRVYQAAHPKGQAERAAFVEKEGVRARVEATVEAMKSAHDAQVREVEKVREDRGRENQRIEVERAEAQDWNEKHPDKEPRPVPELLELPELPREPELPEIPEAPEEPTEPETVPLATFHVNVYEDGVLAAHDQAVEKARKDKTPGPMEPAPTLELEVGGIPVDATREQVAEHVQRYIQEHDLLAAPAQPAGPKGRARPGDRITLGGTK